MTNRGFGNWKNEKFLQNFHELCVNIVEFAHRYHNQRYFLTIIEEKHIHTAETRVTWRLACTQTYLFAVSDSRSLL
ncbi:hypothetical protein MADA3029_350041 [Vibrio nigripulchritudo MADA3029]|uniref:Uncharacterized protein n=2 Tax=Vibrio nigripulchritudo TaxID=28173 RepID=U4KEI7_9VIBR|nr:hypothetical protein VIBNIAM115_370044 [Vibrio nigripulchritudo AM115]CCN49008.1 hypothetical protein VIBNIMADA3020_680041 [Vibrio nigripulchritudo MADA3020]CCN56199.1 hypothetical protein VIBNIMADA3021_90042 [Vibrio nigripulchritudo MADA3021]CCN59133.1 hypothetical protein MADA3029_350041 [Vibrio nigripulchritudo MADA3029]CCN65362.1 hypothetical protein VIBNIPon4_380043 [Vibrio nigripulchritudo POn4]CCN72726.1 hypothetical protein VIBNISFn118_640035 [Vibrio nigripulchritudo SFn118]CCN7818